MNRSSDNNSRNRLQVPQIGSRFPSVKIIVNDDSEDNNEHYDNDNHEEIILPKRSGPRIHFQSVEKLRFDSIVLLLPASQLTALLPSYNFIKLR
jgi:hypothetical protein